MNEEDKFLIPLLEKESIREDEEWQQVWWVVLSIAISTKRIADFLEKHVEEK